MLGPGIWGWTEPLGLASWDPLLWFLPLAGKEGKCHWPSRSFCIWCPSVKRGWRRPGVQWFPWSQEKIAFLGHRDLCFVPCVWNFGGGGIYNDGGFITRNSLCRPWQTCSFLEAPSLAAFCAIDLLTSACYIHIWMGFRGSHHRKENYCLLWASCLRTFAPRASQTHILKRICDSWSWTLHGLSEIGHRSIGECLSVASAGRPCKDRHWDDTCVWGKRNSHPVWTEGSQAHPLWLPGAFWVIWWCLCCRAGHAVAAREGVWGST